MADSILDIKLPNSPKYPTTPFLLGYQSNPNMPAAPSKPETGNPGYGTNYGKYTGYKVGADLLAAAFGGYGAYQQAKLGRDALNFQENSFNKNFGTQAELTRGQLIDREASGLITGGMGYDEAIVQASNRIDSKYSNLAKYGNNAQG